MGSWEIYHAIEGPRKRLWGVFFTHVDFQQLITKLYRLKSEKRRRERYLRLCTNRPALFREARRFFKAVHGVALRAGYPSVYDWVMAVERDPLDWKKLFEDEIFREGLQIYARQNRAERLKALQQKRYHVWDHWLVPDQHRHCHACTKKIAPSFAQSVHIVRCFYAQVGLGHIVREIEFIRRENEHTCARIDYVGKRWLNQVLMSEQGAGAEIGTVNYLKTMVHEAGHHVQARMIRHPTPSNHLPDGKLVEVVSMLFEQLFMTSPLLQKLINDGEVHAHLLTLYQNDVRETLIRMLYHLDMELCLYDALKTSSFKANHLAEVNFAKLCAYYGFEGGKLCDHSWLRTLSHYAYAPFKTRNYVIASVLSQQFFKNYMRATGGKQGTDKANHLLAEKLSLCSARGNKNSWKDYSMACGLKKKISTAFLIDAIGHLIQPR